MGGSQKLVCELTLRDGRVVWDLNGLARGRWQVTRSIPNGMGSFRHVADGARPVVAATRNLFSSSRLTILSQRVSRFYDRLNFNTVREAGL